MVYHETMKRSHKSDASVNVSTLKVHLGRYLRRIRQGEEVVVLDRQHPVAKLVPFSGEPGAIREVAPTRKWSDIFDLLEANDSRVAPSKLRKGTLQYLNEDRD